VLFGLYSDRVGRRRGIVLALAGALLMIPLWAFAPSLLLLYVGGFLMQMMVQGAWGVIPAHITELSPDSVRGFLPGFAYQCGAAVAAFLPWLQARFAEKVTYTVAMPLTAGIAFVLCALVAWRGPERHGITYGAAPLPPG
jgi:SHS family lactate transporter-like MFS transporter